jgi:hypothetical protein
MFIRKVVVTKGNTLLKRNSFLKLPSYYLHTDSIAIVGLLYFYELQDTLMFYKYEKILDYKNKLLVTYMYSSDTQHFGEIVKITSNLILNKGYNLYSLKED